MKGFEAYLKARGLTNKTIAGWMRVFDDFRRWLDTENLNAEEARYNDLLLYMKHQQGKGITQSTVRNYMGVIRSFYEHLLREERIEYNPASDILVKGIRGKKLYHILEPHELQKLYNELPIDTTKRRRNKVMLGLFINQGIKTEEIAKLEVRDVDLREGQIRISGGKKSNSRELQLESHQVMDMYDYVLKGRNEILQMNPKRTYQMKQETDKLFIGDGGNDTGISNMITQLMIQIRKQNPTVINAKQIRASVLTKWLKMYNLREVQYMAGHRYISSTESYQENEMEGLKEEIQQYHPMG